MVTYMMKSIAAPWVSQAYITDSIYRGIIGENF